MTKPDGYYGVIIPKYNFYQGYFLYEDSASHRYLEELRKAPMKLSEGGDYTLNLSDADQELLGGLCATLIHAAKIQKEMLLLRVSAAISVLTNGKYFVVSGVVDSDSKGGIMSSFRYMPNRIDSPGAARDYIHSLPEVQLITGALLREAAELALGEKKRQ